MIEIRDVKKIYKMGDNEVHALRGIDLTIEEGDFVAIMGPSGSGKSTLTQILGLLDIPSEGSYQLNGREVSLLSEDDLAQVRCQQIGFIFQQFNLLPRLSAQENVELPLFYLRKQNKQNHSHTLLNRVGLGSRMSHRPKELSGGQQQRVAIARSLINQPRMILADEPTGNLDSTSEKEVLSTLKELNEQGITLIIVTHEEEVGKQAKRLIRMRDGQIQSDERQEPLKKKRGPTEFSESSEWSGSSGTEHTLTSASSLLQDFLEHLKQGFKTLAANKIRTGLSILGILIGVAAVIAMLALGKGAQKAIENQLASLGSNLLVLRPGAMRVGGVLQESGSTTRLTPEDADFVQERVSSVRAVAPSVNGRGQITYLNKNWNTQILGTTPAYASLRSTKPEIGRFITEEENRKRARVAVIGMTLVRELFGQQNPIGEMIKVNKVSFQVVGILPEKGANGFRDQDDIVIIPLLTAMHRLLGKEYVDSVDIEIKEANLIDSAQNQILELMYTRHRVPVSQRDQSFQIRNMADIQQALTQSSQTMSMLLASIAAISLLVGGIGIMNIMLVSVTERTKEIGLRKAIGARNNDILLQFLAESIVVSVVGGFAGIVLGWVCTLLLSSIAGWATSVSVSSVLFSFFFSGIIGVVFGIYPSKKASALHPIDALRYE
jgi:macrolide transport system ATP-binding/permease protein